MSLVHRIIALFGLFEAKFKFHEKFSFISTYLSNTISVASYMIKVNCKNTRKRSEIWQRCSALFIVNFEYFSQLVLAFLLLTLSRNMPAGMIRDVFRSQSNILDEASCNNSRIKLHLSSLTWLWIHQKVYLSCLKDFWQLH